MNRWIRLGVLLVLPVALACSGEDEGGANSGGSGDSEPPEMEGMTAAHNAVRKDTGANMVDLVWDGEIASVAQRWANSLKNDGCAFEHSSNGYGENIYWASGMASGPSNVVDSWASEEADYDYGSNSCSGVCGHYTQIVWADTVRVGCGTSTCNDGSEIWVCNYDPPGNYNGERPY